MKALKLILLFLNIWPAVFGVRDPRSIEYLEKKTHKPSLEELKTVLEDALKKNFAEVSVEIIESPDLTEEPFHLASSGIAGDPLIFEYGNDDNLLPLVDRSKTYDLVSIIREIGTYKTKDFFALGAGAGPFEYVGQNCEGIFNLKVYNKTTVNENRIVRTKGSGVEVAGVSSNETRAALLGNVFLSEGKPGKVLRITARNRTGEENFISAMRVGLTAKYNEDAPVGLGGVFVIKTGIAYMHVMDEFSDTPINSDEDLNNWLTWHNFTAPLIALGNFVSHQTDFKLRFQHFHSFSQHNEGGHYHFDVTPETVEYEGIFNVADRIILIDKNFALLRTASSVIIVVSAMITKLFR